MNEAETKAMETDASGADKKEIQTLKEQAEKDRKTMKKQLDELVESRNLNEIFCKGLDELRKLEANTGKLKREDYLKQSLLVDKLDRTLDLYGSTMDSTPERARAWALCACECTCA